MRNISEAQRRKRDARALSKILFLLEAIKGRALTDDEINRVAETLWDAKLLGDHASK